MSTPAYDGKGQPPVANGWFSGLAAWWNGLTPQYVTHATGSLSASARNGVNSGSRNGSFDAPTGASEKPSDSSGTNPAASGMDPSSAPCAVKP